MKCCRSIFQVFQGISLEWLSFCTEPIIMSHATFLISRKISNHDCNSPLGRRYSLISDATHYATNQESVLLIGLLSMHLKLKAD